MFDFYKKIQSALPLLVVVFLGSALLVLNGKALAQVAAPRAELTFISSDSAVDIGDEFTVDLMIDTPNLDSTTERISGADLIITYAPDVLEVVTVADGVVAPYYFSNGQHLSGEFINNTTGQARIIYGSGTGNTKFGPGTVTTLTFRAIGSGSSDISVHSSSNGITATNINENVADNIFPAAITVNDAAVATLSLTSAQSVFVVGETVTVDLYADTNGQNVDGIDALLDFDPAILQVATISQGTDTPFSSYPALEHDNTAGSIDISANIGSGTTAPAANGSTIHVAQIIFNAVLNGSTGISFDFTLGASNDSNMVQRTTTGDGTDILGAVEDITFNVTNPTPTPTATPTATPTNTPTPTPTVPVEQTMTVKIQLEGRSTAGKSNAASATITAQSLDDQSETVFNVTTNTNGEASIDILPGNYKILIDVPTYLAKVYGTDAAPVQVIEGNTLLDLSSIPLRAGDFNDDTIVNEVDYSLHYLTTIFTNATLTDINGDGTVNSLDFSIMRRNWSFIDDIL